MHHAKAHVTLSKLAGALSQVHHLLQSQGPLQISNVFLVIIQDSFMIEDLVAEAEARDRQWQAQVQGLQSKVEKLEGLLQREMGHHSPTPRPAYDVSPINAGRGKCCLCLNAHGSLAGNVQRNCRKAEGPVAEGNMHHCQILQPVFWWSLPQLEQLANCHPACWLHGSQQRLSAHQQLQIK